jgi:hypothetical protein
LFESVPIHHQCVHLSASPPTRAICVEHLIVSYVKRFPN